MKIEQKAWTKQDGWKTIVDKGLGQSANFVLVFGSRTLLEKEERFQEIKTQHPNAHILSGTTAGEIYDTYVVDESLVVTAIEFVSTKIKTATFKIGEMKESREAGIALGSALMEEDLAHVFVLSDGLKVNGSELVVGLHSKIPHRIPVTGGLCGDAASFEKTLVGLDAPPEEGNIIAVGFYGDRLRVGHGSFGGWDSFGPKRVITKAENNVLYELDRKCALDLYKGYLGKEAEGLPGTALLFPLSIKLPDQDQPIVRTILGIDEANKTMTFAGDMPIGAKAQLMKANFERLIDGAATAAEYSIANYEADIAICISCVGRKLVLGQRVEEEVEEVRAILGEAPVITGFYSYGEISPFTPTAKCELHNQTMTITTLSEE